MLLTSRHSAHAILRHTDILNVTPAAFAEWLKRNPLQFTPGTAVLYSNFGFELLAAALSVAAGQSPTRTSSPSES